MAGPETPKLMVDVVIPSEKGVVLIRRANEPFEGQWALPGGFVEVGETVEEAAILRPEPTPPRSRSWIPRRSSWPSTTPGSWPTPWTSKPIPRSPTKTRSSCRGQDYRAPLRDDDGVLVVGCGATVGGPDGPPVLSLHGPARPRGDDRLHGYDESFGERGT